MSDGRMSFARKGDWLVLKFTGQIRFTMGGRERPTAALDAFLLERFREQDFKYVLIDLAETESIDSTNLGLLAKIAADAQQRSASRPIINVPDGDLRRLLESVGFDRVFRIVDARGVAGDTLESLPQSDGAGSDRNLVLDAHRTLASLSPENFETFKDVIRLMESPHNESNERSR